MMMKKQLRVGLNGNETQKVFNQVLTDLARSAPPIPGFKREKRRFDVLGLFSGGGFHVTLLSFALAIGGGFSCPHLLASSLVYFSASQYFRGIAGCCFSHACHSPL